MFLPELGKPDFVDSPKEALPPLRSGWEGGVEEAVRSKRREGELGLVDKV